MWGDNLQLTFDDSAVLTAAALENACNPAAPALSGTYKPIQNLASFQGLSTNGNWKLSVTDNFAEDGGTLTGWSLSFCYIVSAPEATLQTNSPLTVVAGNTEVIGNAWLQMDLSAATSAGVYTLLALPQHGTLHLNGVELVLGSTFTQADIDAGLLSYTHNGDGATADAFPFNALDQNNSAWYPSGVFHILVLQNTLAPVANLDQAIACFGETNGKISVDPNGGTAPYTFSLNGAAAQDNGQFDGLGAGDYTVVVSDGFGFTASVSITVNNPDPITISANNVGSTLTAEGFGGTGALMYSIDGVNFQADSVFENVSDGIYSVTVVDVNGCTATTEIIVSVNTLLATAIQTTLVSCFGGNDGVITATAAGGLPPLEYSINGVDYQMSNVFAGLSAGTYMVTVKDAIGVTSTSNQVALSNPAQLNASANVALNAAIITTTGGTGLKMYSIDGVNFQASNAFNNLVNGVYTATVVDANGCTTTVDFSIEVPALSLVSIEVAPVFCFGETTTVTVNAAGGIPPYTYSLNNGAFQGNNVFENVAVGSIDVTVKDATGVIVTGTATIVEPPSLLVQVSVVGNDVSGVQVTGGVPPYEITYGPNIPANGMNLPNGNYSITVTDNNGCVAIAVFTINYTVVSGTAQVTNPLCNGDANGSIVATALNGTAPYSYSLDGINFQSSNTFNGLSAGVYSVVIKDALGDTYSVSATLTNPAALTAMVTVSFDTITVGASGGTGAFTYSLDGVNYQPSNVFLNNPVGTYAVRIKDSNGCVFVVENVRVTMVSATNIGSAWGISVLPNPSYGYFRIVATNAPSEQLYAEVVDMTGRILLRQQWQAGGANWSTEIDLSAYPQGIYTLRLTDGHATGVLLLSVVR